jgi:uncharacterized protein YeaO (DUF488 family)
MGIIKKIASKVAGKVAGVVSKKNSSSSSSSSSGSSLPQSTIMTPTTGASGTSSSNGSSSSSSGSSRGSDPLTSAYYSNKGSSSSSSSGLPMSTLLTPTPGASVQTQVAQDIGPISTISPAVSQTGIRQAVNYYQQQRQMDIPVFQAAKGAGQIAVGKITGKQKKAYSGIEKAEEKATTFVSSVYPSGQAEKAYSEEVKSFNARTENLSKELEDYNKAVAQYPEGAPAGVYERLKAKEEELNLRVERQRETANVLEEKGKQLDVKGKYSFEKFSRGVVTGIVSAALFVPKVVVSPVKTVTETGKGLMELPEQVINQPAMTVGSILGSVATFYAGGKIGGRIIKGKPIDPIKLDTALKTAEVKPIKTIGVVKEAEIKAYKFSPELESELISRIKAGERISITKSKIESSVPEHQKIISKSIPRTDILSIESTNTIGNVILRRTLVGVEIKKGLTVYKDYTVGEGAGVFSQTGTAIIDTLYMRGKPKKLPSGPTEFFKEREVIKSQKPVYSAVSAEQILRLTKAKGVTFEGQIRKVATKEKQITYADLKEVAESEFKKYPTRKTKAVEVQRFEKMKVDTAEITKDLDPFIDIIGLEKTFKIEGAARVTGKVAEPFEFTREPSTRFVKPFDISKDLNLKALEKPSANTQKLIQQLDKQSAELDFMNLPAMDMTAQIKRSVKAATKEITPTKTRAVPAAFDLKNIERELDKSYSENILSAKQVEVQLDKQKVKTKLIPIIFTSPKGIQNSKTSQFPVVTPIQIQSPAQTTKQIERLMQTPKLTTPQITTPIFQTPRIPKIDIPYPFAFGSKQESAGQKELKKLLTKKKAPIPKYTVSIGAAAFQRKPIKVSRKEYKRLSKVTYTGAETRPILQIIDEDAEKTAKKFIQSVKF